MTRFLKFLSVPTLAAGLLVGLGATGSAMAFTAAGRAHLEIGKVPVSSLSPSVRAHLPKDRLVVFQQSGLRGRGR